MTDEFDPSRYATIQEAAEKLGVSAERVRQFCRADRLGEKIFGKWLINKKQLAEFAKIERRDGRRPDEPR
jgi:hypothetical protein